MLKLFSAFDPWLIFINEMKHNQKVSFSSFVLSITHVKNSTADSG